MSKTDTSSSLSARIYHLLIQVYPPAFRHRFGPQMESVFQDQIIDQHHSSSAVAAIQFWAYILIDTIQTIIPEYISDLKEDTMQHKPLAIIGAILVTPAVVLFAIAIVLQLAGTSLYSLAGNSWLYHSQIIATTFVFLPAAAVVLNVAPAMADSFSQKRNPFSYTFAKTHLYSLIVAGVGLALIAFLFGHDTVGCMLKYPFSGHYISSVHYCWQTH